MFKIQLFYPALCLTYKDTFRCLHNRKYCGFRIKLRIKLKFKITDAAFVKNTSCIKHTNLKLRAQNMKPSSTFYFDVFSTVHHSIELFYQPTLMHNFLYSLTICLLRYYPRHVSNINMPIFRRKNCIHTAFVIFALCNRLHSTLVESGLINNMFITLLSSTCFEH